MKRRFVIYFLVACICVLSLTNIVIAQSTGPVNSTRDLRPGKFLVCAKTVLYKTGAYVTSETWCRSNSPLGNGG